MSNFTDNLEARFNAISEREQKLLFYAVPFVICFVFILGLIEPTIMQTIDTRDEINIKKLGLVDASNNVDIVKAQLSLNPDMETRNQINGVNEQIVILEKLFANELEQLVPPYAMPLVLEQLLAKAKKLRLMSMSSIPPSNIFNDDENAIGPELFKHGLKIRFEGSFFDTRDFLISAEQMGWKLHWREILFEVNEYPQAQVDIELFTLSKSEAYINVN
ncbi:MAG: MSHA biogenesis protein MshJ [Bermanella sp.]|jgi:MSHA biogenesis protein MshJ|uniref:MSHA biogenesis protein MshJ n=1 Tax=Glaciecola sp. 33A TaxID=2057807 RepID=UPI000C32C268|nr:MSHA biogenesis protein MshJ [Glaciecola sp. 33A]PKI00493.1 MSHA biogenesis protein MshJ [Glaciecola sp. 33A]